jgi:hypothetical protein
LQEIAITWGIPALLLLGAAAFAWPLLRCRLVRQRMERRISAVGIARLRNVLLEDGMGGQSFYEYLLLTPGGILSLASIARDGIIFGGERMDTWAQVLGKRTIRFANPLYGMEGQLATLRHHLPKVVLEGIVLFRGNCSFPKGKPEGVWTLDDLAEAGGSEVKAAVVPVLKEAWQELEQRSRQIDPDREDYLLPLEQGPSRWRLLLALAVIGGALAWLLWRLQ